MSYKALYRTYRPNTFQDVVGQGHIVSTLKNIIEKDKVSHAYLFAGPRGTGKTSVAHIFANTLNCSDMLDKTTICGKCEQCLQKVSMDIIEIDAASNNGVGEIRKLIDNSKYATSNSKYKVYIIDEVHMLSKGAFNALLKTLEEPPEHVIFILATTEPHKIPITILSRTQRFNFRRISNDSIQSRLKQVLDKESITYDQQALELITRLANGGMRDALSIADQASAFANANITHDAIATVFGVVSIAKISKLLELVAAKNVKEMLLLSNSFIEEGSDILRLIETILDVMKDFLIFKKTKDPALMSMLNASEVEGINLTSKFAYSVIEVFNPLLIDLKYSESQTQAFELALLKLLDDKNAPEAVAAPVVAAVVPTATPEAPVTEPVVEAVVEKAETEVNIFKTDEIEISTEDVNLTSEAQLEDEAMDEEAQAIEEELLNTQEVNIKKVEEIIDSTDEINLLKMFEIDEVPVNKEIMNEVSYSVNDILNLLVQPNKEISTKMKENWDKIEDLSSRTEYGTFSTLLESTRVITAGDTFVLLMSPNDMVAKEINSQRKETQFVEFIKEAFGEYYLVFAITKEEFEKVKEAWQQAATIKKLPVAKPVQRPTGKPKEENKAEEMGNKIFGNLFNS